jgi:acyl phosphate:glycerol-3-phosphate acyltransferase
MPIVIGLFVILLGYLLGSIPFGLLIVKLKTGKDIRTIESGRTGGTNAMRAGGLAAGIATAFSDIMKGTVAVWIAMWLAPDMVWVHVFTAVAAILGHNYSIYLPERDGNGKFIRLRGGAGGAPAFGGAIAFWPPSVFIMLPVGLFMFFVVGYASVTTISIAVSATIIFAIRAAIGLNPWEYTAYGIFAAILLVWALRPNIKRLLDGTERVVGIRAKKHEPPTAPEATPEETMQDMD